MALYPEIKSITKAEIALLPLQAYEGAIQCIHTAAEAEQAAARLLQQDILGFDTETRPSFRKGEVYPPALLQLASEHEISTLSDSTMWSHTFPAQITQCT